MIELVAANPTGGIWTNPIIVGTVVGLPTSILGILAYRRGRKGDAAAIQVVTMAADLKKQMDECNAKLKIRRVK